MAREAQLFCSERGNNSNQETGAELKLHLVTIIRREKNKEEEPKFTRKTLTGSAKSQ